METNIYLGAYISIENNILRVPTIIKIERPMMQVMNFYCGAHSNGDVKKDDRTTVVIQDDSFWPVICKFEDEEVEQLIQALQKIQKVRKENIKEPCVEIVE